MEFVATDLYRFYSLLRSLDGNSLKTIAADALPTTLKYLYVIFDES